MLALAFDGITSLSNKPIRLITGSAVYKRKADEIVPLLMKGELDMAAIPANLAATLYQKTEGGIQAVAVNTLGVLYVVEKGGDTVIGYQKKIRTLSSQTDF